MIDHILKFMTLGTVLISAIAVYTALHTNNKRLGADIFLRYSDRISNLRSSLPATAFRDVDVTGSVESTAEERRVVQEAIYSIFELYELKLHGFVPKTIWSIWEPDIVRLLGLQSFQRELGTLKSRFEGHPRFSGWIERVGEIATTGMRLPQ